MDDPDISVHDISFNDAWQQLLEFEKTLEWPIKCQSCEAFSVCAKCAATVTNQIENDHYCQIIQSEYKQRKKKGRDKNDNRK